MKVYWGYWQHHKYFGDVVDELLDDFKFSEPKDLKDRTLLQKIKANQESVTTHFKRRDYLTDLYLSGLIDVEYFEKELL